jgi:hypothetical protein
MTEERAPLMRIRRNAEQPPSSIPRRLPASAGYAIFLWLPLLLLFGLWRPWGVPVASLLAMALGIAALCHISWTFVWRRRLAREERAAAAIRRQRLAAALSRGPRPAPPQPGPDPDARRRRALLDAVDKHGAISPEARAAADAIAEHRTK